MDASDTNQSLVQQIYNLKSKIIQLRVIKYCEIKFILNYLAYLNLEKMSKIQEALILQLRYQKLKMQL